MRALALVAILFPVLISGNWVLTFSDEFNGQTKLDTTKWNPQYTHSPAVINNELQWYSPDQFNFTTTSIKIVAENKVTSTKQGVFQYASGAITTAHKFSQTYGYFEIRAKSPEYGIGLWPAFWLLNDDGTPGEIDIMEQVLDQPDNVFQTFHCWTEGWAQGSHAWADAYRTGWHTFGAQWLPGKVIWYIDGVQVLTYSSPCISNRPNYILANFAVGGDWPGTPSTWFPRSFEIDYIRAYKYAASGGVASLPGPLGGIAFTNNAAAAPAWAFGASKVVPEKQAPGKAVTVTVIITAKTALNPGNVQFKYSNNAGQIAVQNVNNVNFKAGVATTVTNTFTIPANHAAGYIRVSIGVFNNASPWVQQRWEEGHAIFGVNKVVGARA